MDKSKITIFYSWQSDLPKETNQNGIRLSIKSAIPLIEAMIDDLDITLDEATSNTPGSPYIPGKIVQKISKSDVFICDLTPIGESFDKKKKIANPNVLIELGYAVAELGWDRVIILLNTNYGELPNDLPFDVDKHRATPFKIVDKSDKNGKGQLTQILKDAIKIIIEKSPKRPHEEKEIKPEERKRELDIENISWILSSIHIPTFDNFLDEAPDYIPGNIFHYAEGYKSIFRSNTFHIYNEEVLNLLQNIYDNWQLLLSFGHRYDNTGSQNIYKFFFPNNTVDAEYARNDMHMLFEKRVDLTENFKELLNNIRTNYLEINLKDTSRIAFEDYLSYQSGYEK
jgi:hypothetical protein